MNEQIYNTQKLQFEQLTGKKADENLELFLSYLQTASLVALTTQLSSVINELNLIRNKS